MFLKKFEIFEEHEIRILDNLRKIRNRIKYYGKNASLGEAGKALNFMNAILPKLKKLINT